MGENIAVEKQWGIEQQASQAALTARRRALEQLATPEEADKAAQLAATEARQKANIELGKQTTLTGLATEGERAIADALKISESEALKVAAAYQARADVMQGRAGNQAARQEELLAAAAAKTATELQRGVNDNQRRVEVMQLETQLQNQLPETIAAASNAASGEATASTEGRRPDERRGSELPQVRRCNRAGQRQIGRD